MHNNEKSAFLKFFITYFISVAVLILTSGYFYFSQIKAHILKEEEFSLIEYARHIKMGYGLKQYYNDEYSHKFVILPKKHIDIRNFTISNNYFSKFIPIDHDLNYLEVYKTKIHFNEILWRLKQKVILSQIFLLFIFAFISYKLAKNALKPLRDSIQTLDRFTKDLIHDLNTPITSIKLNMKLIEKIPDIKNNKSIERLNKSVHNISELHENLTLLLQEGTFQMQVVNLCDIVNEVVQTHKQIYSNLTFNINCQYFSVKVNENAIKQILQNIISNACKYNVENGYVKIYTKDKKLYIEDGGKGINEPEKIFERSFSGEHSSGIGLDIVKRLATAMDIKVDVKTSTNGSSFILLF